MKSGRALKVVLLAVGFIFAAGAYPMVIMVLHVFQARAEEALPIVLKTAGEAMILSLYVPLGIFLLVAARDPFAHRSLIAFAACSSFAHASVMGIMSIPVPAARAEWLITAAVLGIIGALLLVLRPSNEVAERDAAA